MDTIRKFYDCDIKKINEKERSFIAVASTDNRDRDGDIIMQEGWKLKNFRKNPQILWYHNYAYTDGLPIGRSLETSVENNKLIFRPQFATEDMNPLAEKVWRMFKAGFLRTFSVGFMPYKKQPLTEDEMKDNPGSSISPYASNMKIWAELLEISAVPIPANPNALIQRDMQDIMAKSFIGSDFQKLNPEGEKEKSLTEEEMNCLGLGLHHNSDGSINTDYLRACMSVILDRCNMKSGDELDIKRNMAYIHLKKHFNELDLSFNLSLDCDKKSIEEFPCEVSLVDDILSEIEEKRSHKSIPIIGESLVNRIIKIRDNLSELIDLSGKRIELFKREEADLKEKDLQSKLKNSVEKLSNFVNKI